MSNIVEIGEIKQYWNRRNVEICRLAALGFSYGRIAKRLGVGSRNLCAGVFYREATPEQKSQRAKILAEGRALSAEFMPAGIEATLTPSTPGGARSGNAAANRVVDDAPGPQGAGR